MVAILEAAKKKQDKFWEVLELMFETLPQWVSHHKPQPDPFWSFLESSGFDVVQLRQDMNDPAIMKLIRQDLAVGQLLGANKSPPSLSTANHFPVLGLSNYELWWPLR